MADQYNCTYQKKILFVVEETRVGRGGSSRWVIVNILILTVFPLQLLMLSYEELSYEEEYELEIKEDAKSLHLVPLQEQH